MIVEFMERIKLLEEQLALTALRASEMRCLLQRQADSRREDALELLRKLYPEDYEREETNE